MHIHAALDSMKAMTASDGRVTDGCYIADPATAVAIWVPPVPLCGLTIQSSTAVVTWSPSVALPGINTSTAKTFTALAVWTPLQNLSAARLCPAQEVPPAPTSTDYTMTMEPALAWLRHAVKWLSPAARKWPVSQYGVKAFIDSHTCTNVPSDFVVGFAVFTLSILKCATICTGFAVIIHMWSTLIVEALEFGIHLGIGKIQSNRRSSFTLHLASALLSCTNAQVTKC